MRSLLVLLLSASWAAAPAPASKPDPLPAAFDEARRAVAAAGIEGDGDDPEFLEDFKALTCTRAGAAQRAEVDRGNALKQRYLERCAASGARADWCEQSLRPNPESREIFECTYGASQPHQLIHPDPSTWKNAFEALALASELSRKGIAVCTINNWWRPEPYNGNVAGAPGRHPLGTAVDVKFCTMDDKERAFVELCRLRKQGRLRALGYYPGSTVLHFGVGDHTANTWGKDCP